MSLEEQEGSEVFEKNENKKLQTAWLVKCSYEQKEILQKKAATSGKNVAQFLVESVQNAEIKENILSGSKENQKEFMEIDNLLERLHRLIYAKIYTLIEKENAAEALKINLIEKNNDCQKDYEELKNCLIQEYSLKNETLGEEFKTKFELEKQNLTQEIAAKDQEIILKSERIEELESFIEKLKREKDILQKQYKESMRSYEIADDRILELNGKVKKLEGNLLDFENTKRQYSQLEKDFIKLQAQYDALIQTETLKREYLEKDLRREFEIALKESKKSNI